MVRTRTGLAPWSLSREAGIESATVDGTIDVPQAVQPVLSTGFVDERGNWKGTKSSDTEFIIFKDEAIANGGTFQQPTVNPDGTWPLDMTGYKDLLVAIKPTNGGAYITGAIMGPDALSYANLSPVNAGEGLKVAYDGDGTDAGLLDCFYDGETISANVWTVWMILGRTQGQKLLQFNFTNNSGDISTIETAFMRIV